MLELYSSPLKILQCIIVHLFYIYSFTFSCDAGGIEIFLVLSMYPEIEAVSSIYFCPVYVYSNIWFLSDFRPSVYGFNILLFIVWYWLVLLFAAAIQCLKRKRLYEQQIEQLGNFQLRIHDQVILGVL